MRKILLLLFLWVAGAPLLGQTVQVSMDTVFAKPGDSIDIPIYVSGFTGIGSVTWLIGFDETVMEFGRLVHLNPELEEGWLMTYDTNGQLGIGWIDIFGADISEGKFADLRFKYNGGLSDLSFGPTCEITNIWGVPISPSPVFLDGLVVQQLSVSAIITPSFICTGDTARITTMTEGGLGTVNYQWTSQPQGFSSTQMNPEVTPSTSTIYHLSATDGYHTAFSAVELQVYSNLIPEEAETMIPADSSTGLVNPVMLNWNHCNNTISYDLYLWEEGNPAPTLPFAADLTEIFYILPDDLEAGHSYHWKIVSKNPCTPGTSGPTQMFTMRHHPDLVVQGINTPAIAYSGEIIEISWQVKNNGLGGTYPYTHWQDRVYLSTDTMINPDFGQLLTSYTNPNSLDPQQFYQKSLSFPLPQGISGIYYIIVLADYQDDLKESNENNNKGYNTNTFLVTLSPVPDLRPTQILFPNSAFSGQNINLTYTISNTGQASTPQNTWKDRIYFSQDTILYSTAVQVATLTHHGILKVDSSYSVTLGFQIPEYIYGPRYFFVKTDIEDVVYEHAFENNNLFVSDSISIILTPPPDLVVTNITIPDSINSGDYMEVSWTVENQGLNKAKKPWTDKVYLSSQAVFSHNQSISTASLSHNLDLQSGSSYTASLLLQIPDDASGPFYVFVLTDANTDVFEADQEDNNLSRSTNQVEIVNPDLLSVFQSLPLQVSSADTFTVSFSTFNQGAGTVQHGWENTFYVSPFTTFTQGSVTYLGNKTFTNNPKLLPGDSLSSGIQFNMPENLSDSQYVYVVTDHNNEIFEAGGETNNIARSTAPIKILTPDLVVSKITIPFFFTSGDTFSVTYTTRNTGQGKAIGEWSDRYYLSHLGSFDPALSVKIGTSTLFNTVLFPEDSLTVTRVLHAPEGLNGFFYLYIETDYRNSIQEGQAEGNNLTRSSNQLTTVLPDLLPADILAPNSLNYNSTLSLSYTIRNTGQGTAIGNWYDKFFLCPDSIYNPATSVELGELKTTSAHLLPNGTLVKTFNCQLPPGLSGVYYLYVNTDSRNQVNESDDENNIVRSVGIINILVPDLAVQTVIIPDYGPSNQPFTVIYSLINNGPGIVSGNWKDQLYLCRDSVFNPSTALPFLTISRTSETLTFPGTITDTVTGILPSGLSGEYYVYLYTDIQNSIPESRNDSNNLGRSQGVFLSQPPDLITLNLQSPATGSSGNNISISYTSRNNGLGRLKGSYHDKFFLSKYQIYHPDSLLELGDFSIENQDIGAGSNQQRSVNCKLPNGISGSYYLYILTDAQNQIFEDSFEENNVTRSQNPVLITLSPWPDLVIGIVNPLSDTIQAGDTIMISYYEKNRGTASTFALSWKDKIYLSNDSTDAGNGTLLHEKVLALTMPPGDSSLVTTQIILSRQLSQGYYYLFFNTDCNNNIYEYTGENNNWKRSAAIFIRHYPPIDLSASAYSGPDTVYSGSTAVFHWAVTNNSSLPSKVTDWTDRVYLSSDTVFNPSTDDIIVSHSHEGILEPLAQYQANISVIFPYPQTGTFYLFFYADYENANNDIIPVNNIGKPVDAQGHFYPVFVALPPAPDLIVETIETPNVVYSGQPYKIKYVVRNVGEGSVNQGQWTDKIWLSNNIQPQASDLLLGSRMRSSSMNSQSFYTDSIDIIIPGNVIGNKILLVTADASNSVNEYIFEANNTKAAAISVVHLPPCDLSVTQISFPGNVEAGNPVTISWRVNNTGANAANGFLKDMIYLSEDTLWSTDDLYFGSFESSVTIGPMGYISRNFSSDNFPEVLGQWHVVIKTDILDYLSETNENNNTGISGASFIVNVPQLFLDEGITTEVTDYKSKYYKIVIPDELTDQCLQVQLWGDSLQGNNELFLKYGNLPTRSSHDYAYENPSSGNQTLLVPSLDAGTYYLLVYGQTENGSVQNIRLMASILQFQVLSIESHTAGNKGFSTLKLKGASFIPSMQVLLQKGEKKIAAGNLQFINPSLVYITFDLTSQDTGLYNVVADKRCGGLAVLENGFSIQAALKPSLEVNLIEPVDVVRNEEVTLRIEFANSGNTDLVSPNLVFKGEGSSPVSLTPDGLGSGMTSLLIELREPFGPEGILRPGYQGSIIVYTKATNGLAFFIKLPHYQ
ncbi:MAG: hypothetical protein NTU44_10610 [Bacteroidetes bacterium]|nr:hypothetical protein [Bacteroidota bacterium]